jgi:hypothetical protein
MFFLFRELITAAASCLFSHRLPILQQAMAPDQPEAFKKEADINCSESIRNGEIDLVSLNDLSHSDPQMLIPICNDSEVLPSTTVQSTR